MSKNIIYVCDGIKDEGILLSSFNETVNVINVRELEVSHRSTTALKTELLSGITIDSTSTEIGIIWLNHHNTTVPILGTVYSEENQPEYTNYSNDLIDFLRRVREQTSELTIDLITCNLDSDEFKEETERIEEELGINIQYSIDKTGNPSEGGDWILESDNVSIKEKYFNETINTYTHLLETITKEIRIKYKANTIYELTNEVLYTSSNENTIDGYCDGDKDIWTTEGPTIKYFDIEADYVRIPKHLLLDYDTTIKIFNVSDENQKIIIDGTNYSNQSDYSNQNSYIINRRITSNTYELNTNYADIAGTGNKSSLKIGSEKHNNINTIAVISFQATESAVETNTKVVIKNITFDSATLTYTKVGQADISFNILDDPNEPRSFNYDNSDNTITGVMEPFFREKFITGKPLFKTIKIENCKIGNEYEIPKIYNLYNNKQVTELDNPIDTTDEKDYWNDPKLRAYEYEIGSVNTKVYINPATKDGEVEDVSTNNPQVDKTVNKVNTAFHYGLIPIHDKNIFIMLIHSWVNVSPVISAFLNYNSKLGIKCEIENNTFVINRNVNQTTNIYKNCFKNLDSYKEKRNKYEYTNGYSTRSIITRPVIYRTSFIDNDETRISENIYYNTGGSSYGIFKNQLTNKYKNIVFEKCIINNEGHALGFEIFCTRDGNASYNIKDIDLSNVTVEQVYINSNIKDGSYYFNLHNYEDDAKNISSFGTILSSLKNGKVTNLKIKDIYCLYDYNRIRAPLVQSVGDLGDGIITVYGVNYLGYNNIDSFGGLIGGIDPSSTSIEITDVSINNCYTFYNINATNLAELDDDNQLVMSDLSTNIAPTGEARILFHPIMGKVKGQIIPDSSYDGMEFNIDNDTVKIQMSVNNVYSDISSSGVKDISSNLKQTFMLPNIPQDYGLKEPIWFPVPEDFPLLSMTLPIPSITPDTPFQPVNQVPGLPTRYNHRDYAIINILKDISMSEIDTSKELKKKIKDLPTLTKNEKIKLLARYLETDTNNKIKDLDIKLRTDKNFSTFPNLEKKGIFITSNIENKLLRTTEEEESAETVNIFKK